MTNWAINRKTNTITFSLPPEMAEQVQDVMREEGRTMSEFIRETLRNYREEREWLRAIAFRLRVRHRLSRSLCIWGRNKPSSFLIRATIADMTRGW